MNPATMASREPRCLVCHKVAYIEDVNARLFDENGAELHPKEAADYMRSIGLGFSTDRLYASLRKHQAHVGRQLRGEPIAAASIQVIEINETPVSWVSVNQQSINTGMEALRSLAARLAAGDLEARDEIEIAKMGLGAAHKRGDMEMRKGLMRDQEDDLLRLVSGFEGDT